MVKETDGERVYPRARGHWIFWIDSCQLGTVSTEHYSLTYRTMPWRTAACVFSSPASISPSLSHFFFLSHAAFADIPRQDRVIFLQM